MTEETLSKADAIRLEIRSLESARTACRCPLFQSGKLNLGDGSGRHYEWVREIHDLIDEKVNDVVQYRIDTLYAELRKL